MPSLFTPPHYNGKFLTIQYLSPEWGVKIVAWQFGKPNCHAFLPTMFEAVGWVLGHGLMLATPQMKEIFENDVLNG